MVTAMIVDVTEPARITNGSGAFIEYMLCDETANIELLTSTVVVASSCYLFSQGLEGRWFDPNVGRSFCFLLTEVSGLFKPYSRLF